MENISDEEGSGLELDRVLGDFQIYFINPNVLILFVDYQTVK